MLRTTYWVPTSAFILLRSHIKGKVSHDIQIRKNIHYSIKNYPKFYRRFRVMGSRILKILAYDSCPSIIQLDVNLGPVVKEFCRCNWSLKEGDLNVQRLLEWAWLNHVKNHWKQRLSPDGSRRDNERDSNIRRTWHTIACLKKKFR